MEGLPSKRRRIYSLEPNKIAQAVFARKYLSYLVPALMKIKEKSSEDQDNNTYCDLKNALKHEVDMALVFSAPGFAWSNALKVLLQNDVINVGRSTSIVESEVGEEGSSRPNDQNRFMVALGFSSNPSSKAETKKVKKKSQNITVIKDLATDENDDEKIISNQWSLRRLVPGGEEICEEEMAAELKSYISCLQMQVNILQCLAEPQ